jgi:hypothetical protein
LFEIINQTHAATAIDTPPTLDFLWSINQPCLYRSAAKDGTTRFYAYATIYVIQRNKRVTLAIHAIPVAETLVATMTYL